MTDRPIIFSGPMVLALLAGRKTQTRRLANSPLRLVQAGDRLYVRESFRPWTGSASGKTIVYTADGEWIDWGSGWRGKPKAQFLGPARPSIHMPRWASRLTLNVVGVTIEPLQHISPVDCVAEGHPRSDTPLPEEVHQDAARDWYMDLWDSLHRKEGERWRDNPPVVAIEFEVEQRSVDRLAA